MVKPIGARRKLIAKRNELKNSTLKQIPESASASGWQKNNTETESIPSDNEGYQADGSEIVWEDDDAEFSLSQYQDIDYNYEVRIYMHCGLNLSAG